MNEKDLEVALKHHPLFVRAKITDFKLHTRMTRDQSGKLEQDEPRVQAIHI
jgi:hypothetical protein